MKLSNKVAIVTGGSRGIGKTIAEFFVRDGAQVIIIARDKNEISGAIRDIECVAAATKSSRPAGIAADVADFAAVTRAIRRVGKKYRRIDILVNAAGIQAPIGPFVLNNMEDWQKNIAVNLFGTAHACKAVLPFMIKRRGSRAHARDGSHVGGSIINFAGGGATSSRPNFSAYAAAKTAVVKLTEILADELAPQHIRVNAISPGGVNTTMLAEVLAVGAMAGKAELAASRKRLKDGGVAPELAAALAVFLASSASAGLTGRLISAPRDNWQAWGKKEIKKIMATERFKLRRIK